MHIIRDLLAAHGQIDYSADMVRSVEACLIRASQASDSVANIFADPNTAEGADPEKAEKISELARRIKDGPLADAYDLADQIEAMVQEAAALLLGESA